MSEQKTEQKIEAFWRDATAEDVAGIVKTGKPIPARIRNANNEAWREDLIAGWGLPCFLPVPVWIDEGGVPWRQCQVYDPQQWWLDKPDPGKGWRLLGKFPDEPKLATDEFWNCHRKEWRKTFTYDGDQAKAIWYRRRIEPNSPEKLDSSTCASNIPKGWTALSLDEPRLESDAYWSQDAEAWIIVDGWLEAANRDKWPAIRQVETHKTMQLVLWCQYRLPNGRSIKVTKEGFELL